MLREIVLLVREVPGIAELAHIHAEVLCFDSVPFLHRLLARHHPLTHRGAHTVSLLSPLLFFTCFTTSSKGTNFRTMNS